MGESDARQNGTVYLVGAGPGDAGLITLRGVECLARADVVLYDYLVNPQILRHARAGAELVCLGRHGVGRILSQDEVNARLVELAREGKTVVRLKGGDPAVFARGAEEVDTLARHGVAYEVVPGITVALAAGSCAGIPVTHRDLASAVALVTGQERDGKDDSSLDAEALARFPGTLVYYMGVTTAAQWTSGLIAAGKPADTPAAIIRRCSFPDQVTIRCTLGEVAATLDERRLRPPVIIIVGHVAALPAELSWFEQRPLFGVRVLVTRPYEQVDGLAQPLAELGAEVLVQPAIEIAPPAEWTAVDAALRRLPEFDWLVFSSSNGVRYLLDRILTLGMDLRCLGGVKLATVGPGTARTLAEYRLRADLIPEEFRAESLAAALAGDAAGKRFLLARASRGREVLAEQLRSAGGEVEQVVVYQSTDVERPDDEIARRLAAGEIDYVAVTSSAIARSLAAMFGEALAQTRLVSISPVTSETLRSLGLAVAAEAGEYTMSGVAAAIRQAVADSVK
ncbi:MAG: uroporphyrinogen-III C-methyltransferase [Pirellulaceae bacterium]